MKFFPTMDYIALNIQTQDEEQSEILMALLSDWPFDSFDEQEKLLHAYIREKDYTDCRVQVEAQLNEMAVPFTVERIADRNWNEVWESNFEPIEVEGKCSIRAPFHTPRPDLPYDIVIMPKMAFGTGHHATTQLMVEEILDLSLQGLNGLDMGCGTAVLAILAMMRGAAHMDAIDIDEWAYINSGENVATNGFADRITTQQGDASLLAGRHYDFVQANINRNILLADMAAYVGTLAAGGKLVMSGILEADIPCIVEKAESLGMHYDGYRLLNGWASVRFTKE